MTQPRQPTVTLTRALEDDGIFAPDTPEQHLLVNILDECKTHGCGSQPEQPVSPVNTGPAAQI